MTVERSWLGSQGGTGWGGHEQCEVEVSRGIMVAVELSVWGSPTRYTPNLLHPLFPSLKLTTATLRSAEAL